eukprot:CAMPEP_0181408372 /NCGR_PEP_ID=MMETSP1110-20121109/6265_1 /TAXON_ID=174948 /ORGANISM="Symbiodinium sp., Strain CCMP421" /LENGTH=112 /DNA_ID=CAMNT_0023530837 /DNA_START=512 /DNA_END=848 /DNA_ORIENTATION=+
MPVLHQPPHSQPRWLAPSWFTSVIELASIRLDPANLLLTRLWKQMPFSWNGIWPIHAAAELTVMASAGSQPTELGLKAVPEASRGSMCPGLNFTGTTDTPTAARTENPSGRD